MKTETRATHTPGPWTFYAKLSGSETHRGFKLVSLKFLIGELIPIDEDGLEGKANAYLIAAAPDMLEALEAMLQAFVPVSRCQAETTDKARAAIAKAKGGAA